MCRDVKWWEFWNPRSGAVGGVITGIMLVSVYILYTGML